jgi:hypothetical protein
MKKFAIAAASVFMLAGVAACGESAADKAAEKQADAIEATGEARADQLESQAATAPTAAQADALNAQADQVEKNADRRADQIEQQGGDADRGMTTHNTPTTN